MIRFFTAATPVNVASSGVTYPSWTVDALRGAKVPEADILAGVRAYLAAAIDDEAERLRALVATPGTGQAMEYQQAIVEALDALAAQAAGKTVAADQYPMLAASVGLDRDPTTRAPAVDVFGVARAVKTSFDAWLVFGAAIRKARLSGKTAIAAAASVADAAAAFETVAFPVAP